MCIRDRLTIDAARLAGCNLTEDKLRPDPSVAGRFIYTVEADREKDRCGSDSEGNHRTDKSQ